MILESKKIEHVLIDIAEPGQEPEKEFMQKNSTSPGATSSDTNPRNPLPPQFFNDQDYCGDYEGFDLANEIDEIEIFLKLQAPPPPAAPVVAEVAAGGDTAEEHTNGNGVAEGESEKAEADGDKDKAAGEEEEKEV